MKQTVEVSIMVDLHIELNDDAIKSLRQEIMDAVQESVCDVVFSKEILAKKVSMMVNGKIHDYTTPTENIEFGDLTDEERG